jgi:hypothetical protein
MVFQIDPANSLSDQVNIGTLALRTRSGDAWTNYGPEYLKPVIEIVAKSSLGSKTRYTLGTLNALTIDGEPVSASNDTPIASVTLEGAGEGQLYFSTDNKLVLDLDGGDWNEVSTVSKAITAAGWATYCSPYALDFTGDIDNLTNVYIVTGATGSTLNLTSVKGGTVPANTGLLFEGLAGDVVIPVVASSSTDVTANKLVGKTEAFVLEANGGYVLMNETPGVGFYKNQNAFTVGANTAYLPANFAGNGARPIFFSFGETSGINEELRMKNEEFATAPLYDLQGRQIENGKSVNRKLLKGVYIVNGKKVIKN